MTLSTHITTPATSVAELERLKVLHNGQKEKLAFPDAEFERRLSGLHRIMAEKQLDAVILTTCHGIKCYSDSLCTTFCRNCALVVTANVDAGMPWRTSYGENVVHTDWRRDNFYHGPQEALRQRGVQARRPGVEDDALPLLTHQRIQAAFEGAGLLDVSQDAMRHAPADAQVRRGDRGHRARGQHRGPRRGGHPPGRP